MITYSICISGYLNSPQLTFPDQIDFEPGTTPLLPEVGDEISFVSADFHFSMTVEGRYFSYGAVSAHVTEVIVHLSGEAILLEDFASQ